jgi:hypothetical protein
MRALWFSAVAVLAAWAPIRCNATPAAGAWVSVNVEVAGRTTPLYASSDGSRYYVEARQGQNYSLHLSNRTGERLAVEISVDGLNVISGERSTGGLGRMYVLAPWESTSIQGWRTSLESVRRFTFVDEKVSYAARAGKANGKMGWIEVAVHREIRPVAEELDRDEWKDAREGARRDGGSSNEKSADAQAAPAPKPEAPAAGAGRSYPGTGWGDRLNDSVRLVDFNPQPTPVERVTLRYEYRATLQALGVLPSVDRLTQRERGDLGFVPPPRW